MLFTLANSSQSLSLQETVLSPPPHIHIDIIKLPIGLFCNVIELPLVASTIITMYIIYLSLCLTLLPQLDCKSHQSVNSV